MVLVFDVNETLLDLAALDPAFERAFGEAKAREEWFQQLLALSLVATLTDSYQDFAALAKASLRMTAARRAVQIREEDAATILEGVRRLPPHPDVAPALDRLRRAGMTMATLTNSPPATAEAQLENAGLRAHFDKVLSVETVRRYKPAREPYLMAADALGVDVGEVLMIAAHAWDVAGAMRAGCRAAFVARPGKVLSPLQERPVIVGADLEQVASAIVAEL